MQVQHQPEDPSAQAEWPAFVRLRVLLPRLQSASLEGSTLEATAVQLCAERSWTDFKTEVWRQLRGNMCCCSALRAKAVALAVLVIPCCCKGCALTILPRCRCCCHC
jgi:hypothetical protein